MNWLGASIGALFGARSGGLLGSIIGAAIGHWAEDKIRKSEKNKTLSEKKEDFTKHDEAMRMEMVMLAAIAAMLAKMAKADGRVSEAEVAYCEKVFNRLGLKGEKREYCIHIFRSAKSNSHTIYDYAHAFANECDDKELREIVYDILWDLANADGAVSRDELLILHALPQYLGVRQSLYELQKRRRGIETDSVTTTNKLNPYDVLGVARGANDEELKRVYREKAKALHPDRLRAQGLSEEFLSRANEEMSRINAAWTEIRKERHI